MSKLDKAISDKRTDINGGPNNVVFARLEALNAIQLGIEAINSTSNLITTGQFSTSKTLYDIAKEQAEIAALCEGARVTDIQDFGNLSNTSMYSTDGVDFTFPISNSTTTQFAVQILTLDSEYEVTLSTDLDGFQTVNVGTTNTTVNTFSTYFDDYYFSQSRETGSLAKDGDPKDLNAILRPNPIQPLGQNTAFGDTDAAINEKGTWNEFYAPMNIQSIANTNDIQVVTLERPLANGTQNTFSVPNLYDALILKRKRSDAGEDAHTPAFRCIVICEGLTINTDWLPVGDNAGDYSAAQANTFKAVKLDDASFQTRANLFYSNTFSTNSLPVFKSLANDFNSTSEEAPLFSGNYPNVERNPLFPAITNKEELQPTGLGVRDVFCGRFVSVDAGRQLPGSTSFNANTKTITFSGGNDKEYRYLIDSASKFFLLVNPLLRLESNGSYTTVSVPNADDPQYEFQSNMHKVAGNLVNFSHDSTTFPLTVSKCLFTTTQNAFSTANTYPSFSAPSAASNSGGLGTTRRLYIKNNGTVTDLAGAEQTIEGSSPGTVATHYYYTLNSGENNKLNFDETIVTYDYQNANATHSTLSRTPSFNRQFEAPVMYNQVNNWRVSSNGTVYVAMIDGLDTRKSNYDPAFEVTVGQTAINANAQTLYESFHTNISALASNHSSFTTDHTNHFQNAISNSAGLTSGFDYSTGSVFSTEFDNLIARAGTFETNRTERIDTLRRRIGKPVYIDQNPAPQDSSNTLTAVTVTSIPIVDTSDGIVRLIIDSTDGSADAGDNLLLEANLNEGKILAEESDWNLVERVGFTPYGRKIFDIINSFVDFDTSFFRNAIEKVRSIGFAFDKIKQDRNIYEVLNNRSKQF